MEKNKTKRAGQVRAAMRAPIRQLNRAFREFTRLEASGGLALMGAALVALIWANSPWSQSYSDLWHTPLVIKIGGLSLNHDLHWWINDALMVIFFFVVGLEIKREILVGELSSLRQAILPIVAAAGGMLFPALVYVLVNRGGTGMSGWGIPMATDIAFAIGVMALAGSRVPFALKVFLTALAIVDDIGAVLVIALFYTADISWAFLAYAGVVALLLVLANFLHVRNIAVYLALGVTLWLMVLQSGLHATIAGVILALLIPARAPLGEEDFIARAHQHLHEFREAARTEDPMLTGEQQGALSQLEDLVENVETPLQRLEHGLHPWVTYGIIPVFALANAGVDLRGSGLGALVQDPVSIGVMAGLVIGKQMGITLAVLAAVKTGLARLPKGISWLNIYAAGWLAGIGFTMSLFIAELAFPSAPQYLESAKLGILAASLLAGVVGYILLKRSLPAAQAYTVQREQPEP